MPFCPRSCCAELLTLPGAQRQSSVPFPPPDFPLGLEINLSLQNLKNSPSSFFPPGEALEPLHLAQPAPHTCHPSLTIWRSQQARLTARHIPVLHVVVFFSVIQDRAAGTKKRQKTQRPPDLSMEKLPYQLYPKEQDAKHEDRARTGNPNMTSSMQHIATS